MPDTARPILTVQLASEQDCVLARQRAKQIAALAGFELQDQTRIATAVSEIARNAFEYAQGGKVEFLLRDGALRVVVTDTGKGIAVLERIWAGTYRSQTGMGVGLIGARRLMDSLDVETGPQGTRVTMAKRLCDPVKVPPVATFVARLAEMGTVAGQGGSVGATASRALHEQNQELLAVLSDLRAREAELHDREAELRALNGELEETNRGVMVLYAEIADKAQAVQLASEMKTRFLSGVTHELRTPLNSIVSLARLMLARSDGSLTVEQEKQVGFILRSAQNLTEMVNDLLDLARIEAGKVVTNLTVFTAAELLAGLRGMFRPLATNPDVRLIFDLPDSTMVLRSDEGKVAQILRNFISNALKFTRRGTVTVTAAALADDAKERERGENPWIRFSVADTGVGIAPEHRDLVMQEWGQVQGADNRAAGSGLGLPLSRSLAEMLGGSVDFTSEPGVGSVFTVTLPALFSPEAQDSSDHILIVDDDEVSRYLLRRLLAGLTTAPVEEAASAAAALEALARAVPRLLILDLVMPDTDGLKLARELRAQPRLATLEMVLYTARRLTEEERSESVELGVTWISKGEDGVALTVAEGDRRRMEIERALLQVGLSNMHQQEAAEAGNTPL